MRPVNLRCPRTVQLTAGALVLAAPASAVALTAGQIEAHGALQIAGTSSHLRYGHRLTVRGLAPAADRGHRVALEFSTGRGPWHTVAHARVRATGAFRLQASLTRSGDVRVVPVGAPTDASSAPHDTPSTAATADVLAASAVPVTGLAPSAPTVPVAGLAPSAPKAVTVAAKLAVSRAALVTLPDRAVTLRGRLLPRRPGAVVRMQTRSHHRWHTVARARTGRQGGFVLRHRFTGEARQLVRVSFAGDRLNTAASSHSMRLTSLHAVVASWYYDAGNTACGFHAGYGVASPDLPCGTKVTFDYHGRSVTAVVDDRGPFVSGRSFDLNQNTAAALGFGGVDVVWSSV